MEKRALYTDGNGDLNVMKPGARYAGLLSIEQTALLDVPVIVDADCKLPGYEKRTAEGGIVVDGNVNVPAGTWVPRVFAEMHGVAYTRVMYEVVDVAEIPEDRTFRGAWEHDVSQASQKVKINTTKAKAIAQEVRQRVLSANLKPLGGASPIAVLTDEAQAARDAANAADATMDKAIKDAKTPTAIKKALGL